MRFRRGRATIAMIAMVAMVAMVAFLCAAWSVAYIATPWLYEALGWHPNGYVQQLLNSLLGLLILMTPVLFLGQVPRRRQINLWNSMIDAMGQIAKGNFDVKLAVKSPAHAPNPFGKLVHTINHMAAELQQIEEMRQEFISNVSHEFQSPLTSITGFAKVLQTKDLSPEDRAHYLAIIETESMRLSKLSDNLLKLTSLESAHHPFEPKPYRLDRQLRNIVLSCEPLWTGKEINLDVALEEVSVRADEDLMSQVWVNLINNSIKFTPHGGTISISSERRASSVVVRISDSGIGIAEADQERIFERFFKADKSRNRAAGGSGLGLSIVKKIVEMHHGSIHVRSRLGEGTTFTVELALEQNRS